MALTLRTKACAAFVALAVAFTGGWEGLRLMAYRDTGGVATICYGATRGVTVGQVASKSQCDARLTADLQLHEAAMLACLKNPAALSDKTYLAILDFTYNVGGPAACGSALMRYLNAGQTRAACDQLLRWVYDNGRIIQGLVNRRNAERALCLSGLQ